MCQQSKQMAVNYAVSWHSLLSITYCTNNECDWPAELAVGEDETF